MSVDMIAAQTLQCKQRRVRAVRFNVDGAYCLTAGEDKKLRLWNPHSGVALAVYGGHADAVLDACGSCDSSQIVSCGADRTVILWDVATAAPLRRYRGHAGAVVAVKYNTESTVAISGSVDNTVMFWDVSSRRMEPVQAVRDARDAVTSIYVDGHQVVVASADGYVRTYDVRMFRVTCDCVGWPVCSVSLTRDSQCVVASCTDGTIRLFDKDSGELLSTYAGHTEPDRELAIEACSDKTDSHVVSGSLQGDVWYWDLISGKCVARLTHTAGQVVQSISHHPTEDMLLSASGDTVKLWSRKTDAEE